MKKFPQFDAELALGNESIHDLASHICQTEISPLESVSQLQVVESETMQHRGMQIVYVQRIFSNPPTKLV